MDDVRILLQPHQKPGEADTDGPSACLHLPALSGISGAGSPVGRRLGPAGRRSEGCAHDPVRPVPGLGVGESGEGAAPGRGAWTPAAVGGTCHPHSGCTWAQLAQGSKKGHLFSQKEQAQSRSWRAVRAGWGLHAHGWCVLLPMREPRTQHRCLRAPHPCDKCASTGPPLCLSSPASCCGLVCASQGQALSLVSLGSSYPFAHWGPPVLFSACLFLSLEVCLSLSHGRLPAPLCQRRRGTHDEYQRRHQPHREAGHL